MICSHASAPLSTHTLAWRRKHDDFFGTGILIRCLQGAFAQLASGRVGITTRPRDFSFEKAQFVLRYFLTASGLPGSWSDWRFLEPGSEEKCCRIAISSNSQAAVAGVAAREAAG